MGNCRRGVKEDIKEEMKSGLAFVEQKSFTSQARRSGYYKVKGICCGRVREQGCQGKDSQDCTCGTLSRKSGVEVVINESEE